MSSESFFEGADVAVTGAAGTVGRLLVERLLELPVRRIRALDSHETGLFNLEQELGASDVLSCSTCDITDQRSTRYRLSGVDYVFHAAALKHVPLCEGSPIEAVRVNVMGTENVIRAAIEGGVRKCLATSSDKAVNPTNVMGATKLTAERLIASVQRDIGDTASTIVSATRFGNVIGSSGSVVPTFLNQIRAGGPVTVTDDRMTRFVMTLQAAANLVVDSIRHANGGEVFVTRMPSLRIVDLARCLIDLAAPVYGRDPADIEIVRTGVRVGEKLFEELLTDEEARRTEIRGDYFVVKPRNSSIARELAAQAHEIEETQYNSSVAAMMTMDEIRDFLLSSGALTDDVQSYWASRQLDAAE